jgi:hypothetical protein
MYKKLILFSSVKFIFWPSGKSMENENKVLTRMSRSKGEMNRRVESTGLQNDEMDRKCSTHGIDE